MRDGRHFTVNHQSLFFKLLQHVLITPFFTAAGATQH